MAEEWRGHANITWFFFLFFKKQNQGQLFKYTIKHLRPDRSRKEFSL